jgi:predicted SAM-dependent methyltransferase
MDKTMYKVSKQAGYKTVHNDALSYLRKTRQRFDGIFASHIIEHMDPNEGVEMIELIKSHLNPKGVAIVITPRAGSLWATENFWLDTTHIRPYPLDLMKKLFQPLKMVEGGIEPDSYVLKDERRRVKLTAKIRKILIGRELFDFVYGGGVWYIVVKKP